MSQLVLDDQLDLDDVLPGLQSWITFVRLQALRHEERILDGQGRARREAGRNLLGGWYKEEPEAAGEGLTRPAVDLGSATVAIARWIWREEAVERG